MIELYLISVAGELSCILGAVVCLLALSTVALFLMIVFAVSDKDEDTLATVKGYLKKALICLVVFGTINALVPSKKDLYIIFGVGTLIDYAKSSDELKKLPDNTLKIVNTALEKWDNETQESDSTSTK